MGIFDEFVEKIENPLQRERTEEILNWVSEQYPNLVPEVKWNQPMFTDHGTFIIAFSVAKHHLAVSPEKAGIDQFSNNIVKAGYSHTNQLFRIPWNKPVDFPLLKAMIEFNMMDKADCSTFWR